jgi:hypothetical protein
MTKLLRFFSALFAADHMLLLCEGVSSRDAGGGGGGDD